LHFIIAFNFTLHFVKLPHSKYPYFEGDKKINTDASVEEREMNIENTKNIDPDSERLNALRRENLRRLAEDMGGQKWLAQKLGKSASQISQLIGRRSHDYVKSKTIGGKLAREIEEALSKERGWLDREHNQSASFQIPVIDVSDYDGEVFDPSNWPQSNIYITSKTVSLLDSHEGDIILLACDNSMSPEINSHDILLCKYTKEFAGDGMYVISQMNHKYVRYINLYIDEKGEKGFTIRGLASYVDEAKAADVNFIARVKEVWSRKKY